MENRDIIPEIQIGVMKSDVLSYLVEHTVELSQLALRAGQPQASALLTLAASDLRKGIV